LTALRAVREDLPVAREMTMLQPVLAAAGADGFGFLRNQTSEPEILRNAMR
jgi:hypothetical protein